VDELDEATLALSALVLGEVSPEEVPLIDAIGPDLLQAAEAGPGSDGALGFGGLETVLAMVVIAVSKEVLQYVGDVVHAVAVEHGGSWIKRLVTALNNKRHGDEGAAVPLLSAEEVVRVREVAFTSAVNLGVDASQARVLADAMGGALGFAPA
jgi:hypothetical protein